VVRIGCIDWETESKVGCITFDDSEEDRRVGDMFERYNIFGGVYWSVHFQW
jgi:hypothetical protein